MSIPSILGDDQGKYLYNNIKYVQIDNRNVSIADFCSGKK